MWVFGYGSLIWKADFRFKTKLTGYVKGYKRRFYQYSVDHRGRPNRPGRVVTLIPSRPDDSVWGVAYEIYEEDEAAVTAHLDYREKTGYKKKSTIFYPIERVATAEEDKSQGKCEEKGHASGRESQDSEKPILAPFELVIYIGTEDNEWFAGPAPLEDIAQQILTSEGPSGTNKEYLYNLAQAMRTIAPGIEDEHLFLLERLVSRLDGKITSEN